MGLLPELPNVRYIRIRDVDGNDINLFRLDGNDEDVAHAIEHMQASYSRSNTEVSIEFMDKKDALCIEWGFIMNTCVPWEEAKKYIKDFEVAISWN